MSSRQKSPTARPMRGGSTRRRRHNSQRRRLRRAQTQSNGGGGGACSSVVSDKLEALKNLIPAGHVDVDGDGDGERKPDQLFQETADYIVLLKTQVLILQRLVDFYGSNSNQNNAPV